MSETRFMQTVLFGGYERAAVEKRFERMLTQISDLKNELRETKLLLAELKKGEEPETAAETVLEGERAKLTQAQVQAEKATKKLKTAEEELAERDAEIAALKEKLAAAEDELQEKSARLLGYESGNDAAALSQVFVAAQQSATQLIQNARREAADLEANSRKLAENVLTEANNTAQQVVYEAEVQAAETVFNAESRLTQMETANTNFRACLLADVERISERLAAVQNAFRAFQENGISTLEQSAEMLSSTKEELTAGGIPTFREPEPIFLNLPPEPVPQVIDNTYDGSPDLEAEKQKAEELARLQAMAAAITGKKPADADGDPRKTVVEYADPAKRPVAASQPAAESAQPAAEDAASALAALAAQAAAIAGKKQSAAPAPAAPAASAPPDLAALAAQAASLKKKK